MILAAKALTIDDYTDLLIRFGIDLAAILIVAVVLYTRRHQRRDLLMVYIVFNLGVFGVLAVVTQHKLSAAVGFGLFALLSIVRLRSEPFANLELGYFFASLVLGVVNGVGQGDKGLKLAVSAVIVVTVAVLGAIRIQRPIVRRRVVLDHAEGDVLRLRRTLAERFGVEIVDLRIVEIDDVRDTTTVTFRFVDHSRTMSGLDFEDLAV